MIIDQARASRRIYAWSGRASLPAKGLFRSNRFQLSDAIIPVGDERKLSLASIGKPF